MRGRSSNSRTARGALAIVAAVALVALAFSGVYRKPFAKDTVEVTADFVRAAQLRPGNQVRIDGNIDGKVVRVVPAPRDDEARVTLAVNKEAGPIYADARARVKAKTLLAGAFYVALDRGRSSAGPLGHRVIPSSRTSVQVELEDVTDVFRGPAVSGLRTLPREMAAGLRDERSIAGTVRAADQVAPAATTALGALRGRRPDTDLRELVAGTAQTVKALDANNDDVRRLVSGAAATVEVTGRRSAEIRTTIGAGPAVTGDLIHTLARLDGTLDIARGLVGRLERSAPDVAPTLRVLRPALTSTGRLLVAATPTLRAARGAEDSLGLMSPRGIDLLDQLAPALKRLDKSILPSIGRPDPITGYKTSTMIGGAIAGIGGMMGQQDGNGHFVRFPASAGASSIYLPCTSKLVDLTAKATLACDDLRKALGSYLDYLPQNGSTTGGRK